MNDVGAPVRISSPIVADTAPSGTRGSNAPPGNIRGIARPSSRNITTISPTATTMPAAL